VAGLITGLVLDRYPECDPGEMLLAVVLADAANQDGTHVYLGVSRMATLGRQSERSVQYHLRQMVGRGFLAVVRMGGGRNRPTEYRIDLEWLVSRTSRTSPQNGANIAPFFEGKKKPQKRCKNGATVIAPDPVPSPAISVTTPPLPDGDDVVVHLDDLPAHMRDEVAIAVAHLPRRQQCDIVDELVGQISATVAKRPLALLRKSLIPAAVTGQLTLDYALRVRTQREARTQAERRRADDHRAMEAGAAVLSRHAPGIAQRCRS